MRLQTILHAHLLLSALAVAGCAEEGVRAAVERGDFDPSALDFGEVTVGQTAARTVLLRNTGTVTLEVTGIEVAPSFSLRGAKGSLEGVRITAGSNIELEVLFLAMEEGEKTGTITVYFEKAEAVLEVRAVGVADLVPDLKLEPTSLSFGTVEVGTESVLDFVIRNAGTAPGSVASAALEVSGALGSPFDLQAGEGGSLPSLTIEPGQSAPFRAVFKPLYEGPVADVMIFTGVGRAQTLRLTLQGNGAPARGGLVCTPSSLNFGPVERGQVASQEITCRASGGIARFVGASFPTTQNLFQVPTPPATSDLAEGDILSFYAEMHAEGVPAVHNTVLTVQFDGAQGLETVEIPVRGEVIPPPVTATAMSIKLEWNTNFTDVDLHLVRPGAAMWEQPGDCYFGNRSPDWGVQDDPTDDPFLDKDDVDGYGPEEINLNVAAPGNYLVYAHYYSDNSIGPSTASVQIFLAGTQVGTFNRQLGCDQSWLVGTINWNGSSGTFTPSNSVVNDSRGFCF